MLDLESSIYGHCFRKSIRDLSSISKFQSELRNIDTVGKEYGIQSTVCWSTDEVSDSEKNEKERENKQQQTNRNMNSNKQQTTTAIKNNINNNKQTNKQQNKPLGCT